jgi:hypothetical protein
MAIKFVKLPKRLLWRATTGSPLNQMRLDQALTVFDRLVVL